MKNTEKTMDKLVALCKGRGFVYPGSEIYGGLANTWDYGPLGVELKNNIKDAWRQKFVRENKYNVGLDSAILMNPRPGSLPGISAASPTLLWTARTARPDTEPTTSSRILTAPMSPAGQISR